jgi:hypothetical protein
MSGLEIKNAKEPHERVGGTDSIFLQIERILHATEFVHPTRWFPPPHRTVHEVLPHTAHRRLSPPAFLFVLF